MKVEEIKSTYPKTWEQLFTWQKVKMEEWQVNMYKMSGVTDALPPIQDKDVTNVLEAMFNFPNWNFLYEFFDSKNIIMTTDHNLRKSWETYGSKGFWCLIDDKQTDIKENRLDAERDGFLLCFEINEKS
jgi:hypothetical protein